MQGAAGRHLNAHKLQGTQALRVLAVFLLLLLVPGICGGVTNQKTLPPQKPAAPSAPAPGPSPVIPVADIASRSTEVANLLRTLAAKSAPSPEIETIRKGLAGASASIAVELERTQRILQDQPALAKLQEQQQLWQGMKHLAAGWLSTLTVQATQLQEDLTQITDLQKTWTLTRNAAQASKAPGPVLQQIGATVSSLQAALVPLQAQRAAVLDLQSRVAAEVARCENALAQIADAQRMAVGGILTRNRPPIWNAGAWAQARRSLSFRVPEIADACWQEIRQYLFYPSNGMPLHAGIFVALALILFAARRRLDQWATAVEGASAATMVFEHPYAAAMIGAMLVGAGTFSPAPPAVRTLLEVLALAPMIRLTRPLVHPLLVPGLYALGILFAVDTVRQTFTVALIGQALLVLEALAGILLLMLFRFKHLRHPSAQPGGLSRPRAFKTVTDLLCLVLSFGLVAGVLGYMRLAILLVPGLLAGGTLALTLYAVLRVMSGALAFSLRVWPLQLLEMVRHQRTLLERRIYRLMTWAAILGWLGRFLDYLGLLQPTLSKASSILATKLERGAISTSVGDILAFFLTVWVAYLLSRFIRFVLQEEVYPRINVPRGMSYATSSLIHYILLALGFVVGMGVVGVKLTQITVLAGAFGVGIGFGLQSVINNFVSGLILLFEHPVHVGDTIELGDLLGTIRRIGIRASIVHTWQGADIIVPNSQLVSNQVTNWTFSDQRRRLDLQVGVSYSAAPKEVIKVLETVAAAHPQILKYPAPQVLFVGYGDSSINFEMRAWTDQFDEWPRIRSDLAAAVYDAVHEAGMSFPFPQREVRLLNDAVVVSNVAFRPGGTLPPLAESRHHGPVGETNGPNADKNEEAK